MAGKMDISFDAGAALKSIQNSAHISNDLKPAFQTFENLYERKLYHQLTIALLEFCSKPEAAPCLIPLHDQFTTKWKNRMNQLDLVVITIKVARTMTDLNQAIKLLDNLAGSLQGEDDHQDCYVLARMETAHYQLRASDLLTTKAAIEESGKILSTLQEVEPIVNAAFYRVSADYFKGRAAYAEYYKNALLYLAYVDLNELSTIEKTERAHDLSVAALLGSTIYNFGELLQHPILTSLKNTPHAWLETLLYAFNAGKISQYEQLSVNFNKMPLLGQMESFLRQKICLMSLVNVVFGRAAGDGRISFTNIAQETRLPLVEVEHLIMKALSLGLIRGSIDQVESQVNVTWVQPRVLDQTQLLDVRSRIHSWSLKIQELQTDMEAAGKQVFVQ